MGQVDQVVGVQVPSPVVLAVPHDVVPRQVLLVEEDYHPVVGMPDNRPAEAEGHVLSLRRINVDDAVTHLVVLGDLGRVGLRPEGEALLINEVRGQVLEFVALQLDGLELLLDGVLVRLQLPDKVGVQRVETHLYEGQVGEGDLLNPGHGLLETHDYLKFVEGFPEEVLKRVNHRVFPLH